MKKLLLTSFAATVLGLQANAQVHAPVPVTGFTADVIADGAGSADNSTTDDVDGGGFNFVAQNYVAPLGQTPTSYLPNGGLINSAATPGMPFQLAPYTGNNSLRLTTANNTGTLTFTTPRTAYYVNLLATSANPSTFTATVNFADGTNQVFAGNAVNNWYDGTGTIAIQGISRVHRVANAVQFSATNPRLFQYSLELSAANTSKTIQSITITKTSTVTTEILHVLAVTASTLLPNDIGISAITAPFSPAVPNVSQPVTVTVKNFGTSPLTAATLGFSVDGTTVVNNFAFTASPGLATNTVSAPVAIGNFIFTPGTHTIKAWSILPNGVVDGVKANDTTQVSVVACNALNGNYTVNKNAVASPTNFASFSTLIQSLGCGVTGPVTITVVPGSGPYSEQVILPEIPGASATNTVTFEGNGNTVTSNTGINALGVIILNGADYVKLNNFKIDTGTGVSEGCGIQLKNASDNITVSNCTITVPLNINAANTAGIVAGTLPVTTGYFTNNSKFQNNLVKGGWYGIYLQGNGAGPNANNQVTGNQVQDQSGFGIYLKNISGMLVENNDMSRPARAVFAAGYYGVYVSGTSQSNLVNKNRIHNTHDAATTYINTGVYGIFNEGVATPGNENIIKNNIIYNIKNSGGDFYGLYNNSLVNGAWFYNNTVAADPNIAYGKVRGVYFSTPSTNIKFINNLLSLENIGAGTIGIYMNSYSPTATVGLICNNNNLYVGPAGNIGYYFGVTKATLADWKAVNSNAYDQNSVTEAPGFLNYATGNLKPNSPLLDNLGQPVPAVTDDILGAARHATTPDIGAYEFTIQPNDVGIFGISGPNLAGCGLSAAETVTVTIKNYGSVTRTSVPVSFAVDGIAIAAPETFTGSIAPNGTATYTFTAKANLATSGPRVITARTLFAGDNVLTNDSDTLKLVNSFIPGMPVILDFETSTTDVNRMHQVVNTKSHITQSTAASFGTGSAKGLILDGVKQPQWLSPSSPALTWTTNPNNFAAIYFCVSTAGASATDSLILSFNLQQLYQINNADTNLRIMVNGAQVGPTYRSTGLAGMLGNWKKIKVDLTPYKNAPTLNIGLESSVSEAYSAGLGGANLIDNISIKPVSSIVSGLKTDELLSQVLVFPNPSNGQFNIELPKSKTYELEVTDLTGKVLKKQTTTGGNNQLNLEGTAKGIYLLKVSGENGSAIRKLILE